MTEEIKDCPFCGSQAYLEESERGEDCLGDAWVIACVTCPCEMVANRNDRPTANFPDEKDAVITKWNTRVDDE